MCAVVTGVQTCALPIADRIDPCARRTTLGECAWHRLGRHLVFEVAQLLAARLEALALLQLTGTLIDRLLDHRRRPPFLPNAQRDQHPLGRAPRRERVCQYGSLSVVARTIKQKQK